MMTGTSGLSNDGGYVPQRVQDLQEGYKKKRKAKPPNYTWRWYGKWWDRNAFELKTYISEDYKSRIDSLVLDSWLLLDENATVALEEKYICAYHGVIQKMCRTIQNFGPLPRSKPTYRVAAARHPLGIVLHGQRLRTGETLQLVASIEHNKPIWMFIGACLYKILEKAQGEEPTPGEGHKKWEGFVGNIKYTLGLLGKRGLTKLSPPSEELTERKIEEVATYILEGETTVGDLEKSVVADIHMVFCRAPHKNMPDGRTTEKDHGEYMAHVPHMFEWYLRKTVCEKLGEQYRVAKETVEFPRRKKFENKLEPDIVIRQGGKKGPVRACIDAKLKLSGVKDRNDMYQMAVYTDALEPDERRLGEAPRHIRGVVFVAVYGETPGSDDPDTEEREEGEIRFMFCHLHNVDRAVFEDKLNRKVGGALNFLLGASYDGDARS